MAIVPHDLIPAWVQEAAQREAERTGIDVDHLLIELRAALSEAMPPINALFQAAPDARRQAMSTHMTAYLARRPPDDAFKQRLAASMERNRDLLDRLAQT